MRLLAFALAGMCLSACATVSVVPKEAKVKTAAAQTQQSELRQASQAYVQQTVERGWIVAGPGWTEMAMVLLNGRDETAEKPTDLKYADRLMLKAEHGADPVEILVTDTKDASSGLAALTDEVETLLAKTKSDKLERADVTSYERALVHAQKSRKSFIEAAGSIQKMYGKSSEQAELALTDYEGEIDRARRTANRIADVYAQRITGFGL